MKYHPILFSTEMVRAILEGRKTQTRRIIKNIKHGEYCKMEHTAPGKYGAVFKDNNHSFKINCPYGKVGDVLWVRETHLWVMLDHAHDLLVGAKNRSQWVYKTSRHQDWIDYAKEKYGYKWKPSIHMPKEACRISLKITDIRVDRLQDISRNDAASEGIQSFWNTKGVSVYGVPGLIEPKPNQTWTIREAFMNLWTSINGSESWEENPWVWVVEFEKTEKPSNFTP
jgi:hypothetical protein